MSRGRFYRQHVNDLDALLKTVSHGQYVVFTAFSLEYRELAVNWYYSITHFGRVSNVLVTAFDDRSLIECMILGFPCFNASTLVEHHGIPSTFDYGSESYFRVTWGKAIMIHALLQRNYSPLISDMDTFWFSDALRSMALAIDHADADAIGMDDDNRHQPNTGNMLFANNARTRALAEAWVSIAFNLQTRQWTTNASKNHEQAGLYELNGTRWQYCKGGADCLSLKAQGIAAIFMHPWHGCPGGQQPCHGMAYFHIFCTGGGFKHKKEMSVEKHYWFVGLDANQPHMIGARAVDLFNATGNYRYSEEAVKGDVSLPCRDEIPPWSHV